MLTNRLLAEQNIRWLIGKGEINAFKVKWLDSYQLRYDEHIKVNQLFSEGSPDEEVISEWLGDEAWMEVQAKNIILNLNADRIIWTANPSGKFSLSSAWEKIRGRATQFYFGKFYWHKHYPTMISIFLWKLLHKALPTDVAIKRKGVPLVSKCACCTQSPQAENATHFFATSEIGAVQVWRKIFGLMDEPYHDYSLAQILKCLVV